MPLPRQPTKVTGAMVDLTRRRARGGSFDRSFKHKKNAAPFVH